MNTKNALFAAQNKSKRTAAETPDNATNATPATDNLAATSGSIPKRYFDCHHGMQDGNKIMFIKDYLSVKDG
ncbi:hypothetical protein ACLD9W_00860 [Neisseria sp. WLZKY-1]|uniref:hypothetical protein n=1 Tax=Neisseria sp. WLZKY-1 TaxID=3390377 RepID=UPI00397B6536